MFKNVASQKIVFVAWDSATGLLKTGDAANLTAYVSKDGGAVTVLADTSASELDATNAKGCYSFDVAQGESNANMALFTCKSSTSGVQLDPVLVFTFPANFTTLVIDSSGLADANMVKSGPTGSGTAQTARDLGASVLLSSGTGTGQISLSSGAVLLQATQTGVTIPTVTNLTNAPTAGDLTATMKTSVTTAATAATPVAASVTGAVGSIATDGITATSIAADAINAAAVKADAVTKIQTGLATPTNITAGTITTVTNLTNAATAGDLTATMKTSVTTAATAATPVAASVTAAVAITSSIKQNQALANFEFLMTDSTSHAPATGATVTCTRSIDGAAFGAGSLANVAEISNGLYRVDFGAGDLNGKVITLRSTATGCDDSFERIVTQP